MPDSEIITEAPVKTKCWIREYSAKLVAVVRQMVKDEALLENKDPEIVEFVKNLTETLNENDADPSLSAKFNVIAQLGRLPHRIQNLPENLVTENTKLMEETMKRYGLMDVVNELDKFISARIQA